MPVRTLRQRSLSALPYIGKRAKQQCIYWDTTLTGLGVRVYPSGRRTFVCGYRFHGRKRLASLGRADVLTLRDACQKAIRYLGKLAADEDPQAEAQQRRSQTTVAELCTAFIENHAQHGWRNDQSCLTRRLLPLQGREAATLVPADIEAIHTLIGKQHPYAANTFLDLVRNLFNWGQVTGLLPQGYANPTRGIARFPEHVRRRFITTVEMPHFIRALKAEDNEYARHGLWLLLLLGLRSHELLNARWSDIDWEMGTLFIGLTKNGDPLLAPLSDAALARLKTIHRVANNSYIICDQKPGSPLTNLGTPLRRVVARAGLQNLRVHDLRRTVGSWLAQSGVSLHLIGDILNHLDLRTTLGYAYFQTEHRREELNDYGGRVLSFVSEPLRLEMGPAVLSAEHVLCADLQPARHRHYFKREGLYELVWTAPITEVAERLGVSDVGLAKLCRRAAIPKPGRGYWARVEAGQYIGITPLPPAPRGMPQLLRIRGTKPHRKTWISGNSLTEQGFILWTKMAFLDKVVQIGKMVPLLGSRDIRKPYMTTSAKTATFLPLAQLPRAPASDLKKLGWRGMMNTLRAKGKLLVTNHDEPEAVIIPVAEYDALMQIVEQSAAQTESALAGLRTSFDQRLSVLQERSSATRLQSTIREHAKLGGKVKAGSGY